MRHTSACDEVVGGDAAEDNSGACEVEEPRGGEGSAREAHIVDAGNLGLRGPLGIPEHGASGVAKISPAQEVAPQRQLSCFHCAVVRPVAYVDNTDHQGGRNGAACTQGGEGACLSSFSVPRAYSILFSFLLA